MVALLVGYYMPRASVCERNVPLKMINWIESRKNPEELAFFYEASPSGERGRASASLSSEGSRESLYPWSTSNEQEETPLKYVSLLSLYLNDMICNSTVKKEPSPFHTTHSCLFLYLAQTRTHTQIWRGLPGWRAAVAWENSQKHLQKISASNAWQ